MCRLSRSLTRITKNSCQSCERRQSTGVDRSLASIALVLLILTMSGRGAGTLFSPRTVHSLHVSDVFVGVLVLVSQSPQSASSKRRFVSRSDRRRRALCACITVASRRVHRAAALDARHRAVGARFVSPSLVDVLVVSFSAAQARSIDCCTAPTPRFDPLCVEGVCAH